MTQATDALDAKLTIIDGKIDALSGAWRSDVEALRSTVVQQEIDPAAQKVITTHIDEILKRLDDRTAEAKTAGGTPAPVPTPTPTPTPTPSSKVAAFRVLDPGGSPHDAGSTFPFQVGAIDADGQVVQGYSGSVNFNTEAPGSLQGLPPQYTFNPAADHGAHTFQMLSHGIGTSVVTVSDISDPNIAGHMTITIQ